VRSGGATSRVIPHTTVVLPSRTRAEEGAVDTEPIIVFAEMSW
jgi:hypothetical protein